jgi:hypothetical protein
MAAGIPGTGIGPATYPLNTAIAGPGGIAFALMTAAQGLR